ncbi:MAG: cobalamin-binding protein [Chloroflexi bacterium]|nr:cobalamin-binding protein [Chloroflexota bacterium]
MSAGKRIVSLVASNTEIVCALGLADRLVGVDDFSDFPPEIEGLPRLGRDLDIDVDRVADLRPDLVLASLSVPGMERNVERLRARGLPYVAVRSQGLDGVLEDILRIGELTGVATAGKRLADRLGERIRRVAQRTAGVTRTRVYWEWWPRPYIAAGGPSWITDLSSLAGGRNVFDDEPRESATVSTEAVTARSPEVAVICWCGARKLPNPVLVARRPGWGEIPAVRDGRLHAVLEPRYGRPGPRLVDGLEELVSILHPELFSGSP